MRAVRVSERQIDQLIAATEPLLGLFAVVDDVFTEEDAFKRANTSLGRIYREWKKVRKHFDPEWNGEGFSRGDGGSDKGDPDARTREGVTRSGMPA